jgi:hypothetical protein
MNQSSSCKYNPSLLLNMRQDIAKTKSICHSRGGCVGSLGCLFMLPRMVLPILFFKATVRLAHPEAI